MEKVEIKSTFSMKGYSVTHGLFFFYIISVEGLQIPLTLDPALIYVISVCAVTKFESLKV